MSIRNLTAKLYRMIVTIMLFGPASVFAAYSELNMPQSVTDLGAEIYDLHMIIFWIVTIAGIAVFAVMIYSIFNHRKSKGAVAEQFHESTSVEVVWTIIPLIILVIIAIPATSTLLKYEDTSNSDITITATGYQWKWKYDYQKEDISFFSALAEDSNKARQLGAKVDLSAVDNYLLNVDNPIVVPVNKKIRVLTTSNDVIHAWWVPDLAIKRDAIPGFINESWFKANKVGTYRGQCAELCGKDHGFMPIVVKVVEEAEYTAWVGKQKADMAAADAASDKTFTMAELMKKGEKAYNTSCSGCHQINGAGLAPTFPALVGSKIATGPMKDHIDMVMNGSKANPMMAAYAAQLNNLELAAIITYERNAWGNNTGDLVQPSEIKAAR
ncbi:Cytochrome c oxidase polypeptide II [hydrothermal vent metagenome]|uniref:cytochrome-c oxidase n=1 Tax=hydrothermal vent metagenome TaxID=652676 RepID=A0A3B1B5R5_9ZZZZ